MVNHCSSLTALLFCALFGAGLSQAADKRLYRYTNTEGNVVIDDRLPSDYAGRGYEIINEKGVVLEVVPRQLTAGERAAQDAEAREKAAAEEAQRRARERDERLLLRYSTVEDIEAAKERSLRELRVRISILKGNRSGLKHKIEELQARAADRERQGQQVGIEQLKAMDDLRSELLSTEQSIKARKAELQEVAAAFDSDIARFEELLELVELRRQKERESS